MENVTFYLKDPQKNVSRGNQKETLIFMLFAYGYFEISAEGKKRYIPFKYSTGKRIYPYQWNDRLYKAKRSALFDHYNLNMQLDNLGMLVKQEYQKHPHVSPSRLRELVNNRLDKSSAENINLNTYIEKFFNDITTGARLTIKNTRYKPGTIKSYKGFIAIFHRFQKYKNRQYDFSDITMDFYYELTGYLTALNNGPNTIGRVMKQLKTIMRFARDEGLHKNNEIENRSFKAVTYSVDNIYLSEEELERIYRLDLSERPHYDLARDVFLVGCYTAQRYSDYSRIRKANIKGNFIELTQQKTGERVIIPIRPVLMTILKKYNYKLPKTYEQKVNRYIKEVGRLAGIDEIVQTETIKGGLVVKKDEYKYELIKTHTARRSGATNMYLAGITSIDIMKVTGHKTEREFLKYIKVTKEQTANSLALHPYFSKSVMKA